MGFGDFFTRAVSVLDEDGIFGALDSLLSHAIPSVGPIIGNGVNAVQALFGQDSEETNSEDSLRVTEKTDSKPEVAAVKDI
ncbi:hypothetical protein FPHYL_7681 [Fusarium phyllophilum]|uniref:Uncharacterized protein n=1 Tax=Fusarium phyllophilum TaxID=47803 RepID=A0A8H5JLF9_9HYPO|nr:hypothetical protein FPHYL_7681 [Fusarium phyllophilum]